MTMRKVELAGGGELLINTAAIAVAEPSPHFEYSTRLSLAGGAQLDIPVAWKDFPKWLEGGVAKPAAKKKAGKSEREGAEEDEGSKARSVR
ncbi:MAG: hypothetical protein IPJ41_17825 [Phycisphaerales bacterium]|nr:hypothetical protein [Phycisphaerales bacterium]